MNFKLRPVDMKEKRGQYEDLQDFLDTLFQEAGPEFQRSLRKAAREIKRGRYLTHTELKLALLIVA